LKRHNQELALELEALEAPKSDHLVILRERYGPAVTFFLLQ